MRAFLVAVSICCCVLNVYAQSSRKEERELAYEASLRFARIQRITNESIENPGLAGDDPTPFDEFLDVVNAIYNLDVEDERLIEGDIRVNYPPDGNETDTRRVKRKVVNDELHERRWTNRLLSWRIGRNEYSSDDEDYVRKKIKVATDEIAAKSCIRFREVTGSSPSGRFVEVVNKDGCWSYVGMGGDHLTEGAQQMSLELRRRTSGCVFHGIIVHEFGHALGFSHEQSRPDRDENTNILVSNIDPEEVNNFRKRSYGDYVVHPKVPYDVNSIMHYSLSGFSSNGGRTLTLKDPELNILAGQRSGVSWYDEVALNLAYDCADGCATDRCLNGGYVRRIRGRCKCQCPPHFRGGKCQKLEPRCDESHVLKSGEIITTTSRNFPDRYRHEECAYLYKAPAGHHLTMEFTSFDLPDNCRHALDVRKNIIGQPSARLTCGTGLLPATISTADSREKDKILVVFDATDENEDPAGGFSYKVTAVPNPCLDDPCHGAPCSADGNGGYKCDFLEEALHCGFEDGLMGSCSMVIPNRYFYDEEVLGRAWDIYTASGVGRGAEKAAEGHYFFAAEADWGPVGHQVGTFSIIPHKAGGTKWCLDFKYAVYGIAVGDLNVYKAVNGEKGQPIFTEQGTDRQEWVRKRLTIDGRNYNSADMIEVVFEAVHDQTFDRRGDIGIDDIKYSPGECHIGNPCEDYPCGTHECVPSGNSYRCRDPSKDVFCSFESAEDECNTLVDLDISGGITRFTYNVGSTPSRFTGARRAHSGRRFLYLEASSGEERDNAYLRIRPFSGKKRKLSLWYHAYGNTMGSLVLYKSVNGDYPGKKIAEIFSGNQGNEWRYYEVIIDNSAQRSNDKVELTLEAVRGEGSKSDISIDDISYSLL